MPQIPSTTRKGAEMLRMLSVSSWALPKRPAHQRSSEVVLVRGHQRPSSEAIRYHQRSSSEAIRGHHQRPSDIIRGHHQRSSSEVIIRGHHQRSSSEAFRYHQRSSSEVIIRGHHQRSSSEAFRYHQRSSANHRRRGQAGRVRRCTGAGRLRATKTSGCAGDRCWHGSRPTRGAAW